MENFNQGLNGSEVLFSSEAEEVWSPFITELLDSLWACHRWRHTGMNGDGCFFGLQVFWSCLAQNFFLRIHFYICLQPFPFCLSSPIPLFYPLNFCISWMRSSFRQDCLCTGTLPQLAYLLFLASPHCKAQLIIIILFALWYICSWMTIAGSLQPSREVEEDGQQLMWKINYELPSSCRVVKAVPLSKLYIQ